MRSGLSSGRSSPGSRAAVFALLALLGVLVPPVVRAEDAAVSRYRAGREAMLRENWYGAAEELLESLRLNPSYAEPVAALAECYYALGEYDQALSYAKRARSLMRGSSSVAVLEASILIALGDLDGADGIIRAVLAKEPYQREALFAAAELDIVRGKSASAAERYREAARRYPEDRRALLSLALVLGSLGDIDGARSYAQRAIALSPDDYRSRYYAAYLDSAAGRYGDAKTELEAALRIRPAFAPARSLLASVEYRLGSYADAARLADAAIAADRSDAAAWYLKGMAYARMGRPADARSVLAAAANATGDEFVIAALEDLLVAGTPVEAAERRPWAQRRFDAAADYRARNLNDQALFEYRRGLRLNPYDKEGRVAYAELLRSLGYPERQLGELRFLQDIGRADQAVNDAVETYDSVLADALYRRWGVDPVSLDQRHWKLAVFALDGSDRGAMHPDLSRLSASIVKDLLSHDGEITPLDLTIQTGSFSSAFSEARQAGADYFLLVSASEGDRDLALDATLYVARTGSEAARFASFRTGTSRLRDATRLVTRDLSAALPLRGRLIARKAGTVLVDKGRGSGIEKGMKLRIVRAGALSVANEGIGLTYADSEVTGTLSVESVDEDVSSGTVSRSGFFDRIAVGDEVILLPDKDAPAPALPSGPRSDPRLLSLLRALQ